MLGFNPSTVGGRVIKQGAQCILLMDTPSFALELAAWHREPRGAREQSRMQEPLGTPGRAMMGL